LAKTYQSAPELTIDLDVKHGATLHTSLGDITVEFLAAEAPQTVNNFLFLAGEGFYDESSSIGCPRLHDQETHRDREGGLATSS
jgi:hypothetical protein